MRLALISDIHGNPFALAAVISALRAAAVDQTICLGDTAIFGPQPCEALALLRDLKCPVVMGNTDAFALDPRPRQTDDPFLQFVGAVDDWCASLLGDVERALIRTFQPTLTLALGGGVELLGFHGSPTSYHEVILPTDSDDELAVKLGEQSAVVLAGGHVHQQYLRRWGGKLLINPGSVGLPYEVVGGVERNPHWAEYALITVADGGALSVDLRRQPYDARPLIAAVRASDMPQKDRWLAGWV